MTIEDAAKAYGFEWAEDLLDASEEVVSETADISWYVVALPDGRWGAWDDISDEYPVYESREKAVAAQREGFETANLPEGAWVA